MARYFLTFQVDVDGVVRLRQACSHPGVGAWRNGAKEMKTMDEVLEKMYEDTSAATSRDERELFISRIKRGQIYDHKKDHNGALELWTDVLKEVLLRVTVKKAEVLELRISTNSVAESESSGLSEDDEDLEDERRAKKLQHLRTKRGNELRDLLELQHRATFMMASANFQLKKEAEEIEDLLSQLEDEASYLEFKEYCQGTCDVVEYFQYLLETEEAPRALQNDSGVSSLQRLCVALLWKTLCAAPQTMIKSHFLT